MTISRLRFLKPQPVERQVFAPTLAPSFVLARGLKALTTQATLLEFEDRFEILIQSAGAMVMKNVYEVLRQKEMELTRLEKEVEALRLVAPLLSEEKEMMSDMGKPALATAVNGPQATARLTVPAPPSIPAPQPVRAAGWEDTAKRWP
jgi:hypothetical protein